MGACAKIQKKSSNHLILKKYYIKGPLDPSPFCPLTAGDWNIRNMWNIRNLRWNIQVNFRTSGTVLDFAHVPDVPNWPRAKSLIL